MNLRTVFFRTLFRGTIDEFADEDVEEFVKLIRKRRSLLLCHLSSLSGNICERLPFPFDFADQRDAENLKRQFNQFCICSLPDGNDWKYDGGHG